MKYFKSYFWKIKRKKIDKIWCQNIKTSNIDFQKAVFILILLSFFNDSNKILIFMLIFQVFFKLYKWIYVILTKFIRCMFSHKNIVIFSSLTFFLNTEQIFCSFLNEIFTFNLRFLGTKIEIIYLVHVLFFT